jgi:dCMP deaminase
MATQQELDKAYMKMAVEWGKLSKAQRRSVGALVVKEGQIISDGFNGTPQGFPNVCEDSKGETLKYVLHAESNAITKLAKSTQSSGGSTLYVTMSPCTECAKLIIQAGIERVVYLEEYRLNQGINLLEEAGISVNRLLL